MIERQQHERCNRIGRYRANSQHDSWSPALARRNRCFYGDQRDSGRHHRTKYEDCRNDRDPQYHERRERGYAIGLADIRSNRPDESEDYSDEPDDAESNAGREHGHGRGEQETATGVFTKLHAGGVLRRICYRAELDSRATTRRPIRTFTRCEASSRQQQANDPMVAVRKRTVRKRAVRSRRSRCRNEGSRECDLFGAPRAAR